MTNIHVWTPARYKFEGLKETLLTHSFFQNNKIKSVKIHYRQELTNDHLFDILSTALHEHEQKSVNIFVYDDDELEDGCGLETLELSIQHMINVSKLHPKSCFLFADFVDFLYNDATYSQEVLIKFKHTIVDHVNISPSRSFYKDFQGYIDGADCDCYNWPNESGMRKLFEVFSTVLRLRSPIGSF